MDDNEKFCLCLMNPRDIIFTSSSYGYIIFNVHTHYTLVVAYILFQSKEYD